jgi:Tfp pilus assembly protein PilX
MSSHPLRRPEQRGTVLIIALIVLVALTLAGIAMMRSVDTAAVVAGNIAFKQATINGSDQGLQTAYTWLTNNANSLNSDNTAAGYYSSVGAVDPNWNDPTQWAGAFQMNGGVADASGNIVTYFIHRLCPISNCAAGGTCNGQPNTCAASPSTIAATGQGVDQSQANFFTQPAATHYRITVRTQGPRNAISIVQTMLHGS